MKSAIINVNGARVTCYEDGSISRPVKGKYVTDYGGNQTRCYRRIYIHGKPYSVHRLMCGAFIGSVDGMDCDHINGDPSDNRLENLRIVSHRQNNRGFSKPRPNKSSRFRGVSRRSDGKFRVRIHNSDRGIEVGIFNDETEAAIAWNEAAIQLGYAKEALNKI